ncbi:MAG: MBL fold metallo-hydrolase [Dethiobacteria bacterium]|jgi:L-ascorbate metabolism protein UlaG (beta-lactamase superfamily)
MTKGVIGVRKHRYWQWLILLLCLLLLGAGPLLTGCGAGEGEQVPEEEEERPEALPKQEEPENTEGDANAEDQSKTETEEEVEQMPEMELKITYLGHAAFLLEAGEIRILMDPYAAGTGRYGALSQEADVVTASHEHSDHNYVQAAQGDPQVLRGLTADGWQVVDYSINGVTFASVNTFHDNSGGNDRGRNAAFIVEMDGLRLVHLGDLGHLLNEEQVNGLSPVDILLIPTGGHYTIGPAEADQVIEQLSPRVVIPMHYRTQAIADWPLQDLEVFLQDKNNIKHSGEKSVTVSKSTLPEIMEIWPLSF